MSADLIEHLLTLGPDLSDDESRDRWRIDNDELAAWALRKLAAAQEERDRIKRAAEAEKTRIDVWAADADRQVARDVDFFTARLVEYRRMLEAENPGLPKTYKLPAGSICRRLGSESVVVEDPESFTGWALDSAREALRFSPDKALLKTWVRKDDGSVVSPDGEVVPGVSVQRGEDRYEVRPAAPSAVSDLEPF